MLYFSYGSNLNFQQMASRCPEAEFITKATLPNYKLIFGAGGFATVETHEGEEVEGAIWEITDSCTKALDMYEGFPHFYGKEDITVNLPDGSKQKVMVYIMTPGYTIEPPSNSYYICIAQGYKDCKLQISKLIQAKKRTYQEVAKT
jgi:Uncharacterized conserved protein